MLGSVSNLWSNWTMYFVTKRRRILRNTDHSRICVLTHSSRFALAINHLKHLPVFILHVHQIKLYSYSLEDSNTRETFTETSRILGEARKIARNIASTTKVCECSTNVKDLLRQCTSAVWVQNKGRVQYENLAGELRVSKKIRDSLVFCKYSFFY